MTIIVGDRISGEESPHKFGETVPIAAEKDVGMIGHQSPCINTGSGLRGQIAHARHKLLPISVIDNDLSLFYPPDNHVVQGPGSVQPCMSRHHILLTVLSHNMSQYKKKSSKSITSPKSLFNRGENSLLPLCGIISVNRPLRTRMRGGVGAGGENPPATRLAKSASYNQLIKFNSESQLFHKMYCQA
jgi:hypothetical protein